MSDLEQRLAEIESLASIYPDLLKEVSEKQLGFQFERDIGIVITLPDDYPSVSPPIFELSGPYLDRREKVSLQNRLNESYVANLGFPVIFNWISLILDFIQDMPRPRPPTPLTEEEKEEKKSEIPDDMHIKHSDTLTDRKSVFQAHLALVSNKEEVDRVMEILKSNAKIARATHNIMAYRFSTTTPDGKIIQHHDCEDDGEHGASSKMMELMHRMNANNVIVVVTRWYGGIHLGPDRFRHINNMTRQMLVDSGFGHRKKNGFAYQDS